MVIADINDEKGQAVAKELVEGAVYLHTDVTRQGDVKAAIDLAIRRFGRRDCMYNNAGAGGILAPLRT